MHFLPFKSISVLQCTPLKVLFLGHADGGQMFLYALKGPLYAADHNEIVSCPECFRKMATDRSFQLKANQSSYCIDLMKTTTGCYLVVWVGTFHVRLHSEPHRHFQRGKRSTLKFSLKSENCMIETDMIGDGEWWAATGVGRAMLTFILVDTE